MLDFILDACIVPTVANCLNLMKFLALTVSVAVLLIGLTAKVSAAPFVSYKVTVDTSSLKGQSGDIDLQLDPNSDTNDPLAYATVENFTTDGTLNPSVSDPYTGLIGDVSGVLPGKVYFDNGETTNGPSVFNDYCENITFGTNISFTVVFSGPFFTNISLALGDSFVLDFINVASNDYELAYDPTGNSPYGWIAGVIEIETDGTNVSTIPVAGPGIELVDPKYDANMVVPPVVSFSQPTLTFNPVPLQIARAGTNVTLSWTNAAFDLFSAGTASGPYTNLLATNSPYVAPATNTHEYFRLIEP